MQFFADEITEEVSLCFYLASLQGQGKRIIKYSLLKIVPSHKNGLSKPFRSVAKEWSAVSTEPQNTRPETACRVG